MCADMWFNIRLHAKMSSFPCEKIIFPSENNFFASVMLNENRSNTMRYAVITIEIQYKQTDLCRLPSIYVGYIHSITLCLSVSYIVKCRYVGIIQNFFVKDFVCSENG